MKKKEVSKYLNEKTNGFASKKEAKVYNDLLLLKRAGEIMDVQTQVSYQLLPSDMKVNKRGVKYIADFVVTMPDGRVRVIDAKGMRTDVYILKNKLMWFIHKINIEEM